MGWCGDRRQRGDTQMRLQMKRFVLTAAAAGLLALTAGCGGDGGGDGADGQAQNGVGDIVSSLDKASTCTQVAEAYTSFQGGMTEAGTDADKLDAAAKELSDKLGEIAQKSNDADVKAKLQASSDSWAGYKSDGTPESLMKIADLLTKSSAGCA